MMNKIQVDYEYVGIDDLAMRFAYDRAKELYMHRRWNLKTTPIAVIMKGAEPLVWAASAEGKHALHGKCARLNLRGADYSACEWCREDQHAEQIALRYAKEQNLSVKGCTVVLYGHFYMCDSCVASLKAAGIEKFVLMKDSERAFDRHHPDTVIGTERQFAV